MNKLKHFLFLIFPISVFSQTGVPFDPGCILPFHDIAVKRSIDDVCGIHGSGTSKNTKANQLQNAAKNNFCATGNVKKMKIRDFISLHNKVMQQQIPFGSYLKVPVDRSQLQKLGEGKLVSFTGYIHSVKYANTSTGEGVNCKEKNAENNDIHMELVEKLNEDNSCNRISAEISPHFRPDAWNVSLLKDVAEQHIRMRITGQLFFDASHGACPDGSTHYRGSSWEIHPVYKIEILVGRSYIQLHEWIHDKDPHGEEE